MVCRKVRLYLCIMHDIQTPADIRLLVDSFYERVRQDSLIGPIFNDLAQVNWEEHLPVMYSFWEGILLGTARYQGRPFPKHAPLPLQTEHFSRWIDLFEQTVDTHFSGDKAEEAKGRARAIALVFMSRMGLIKQEA